MEHKILYTAMVLLSFLYGRGYFNKLILNKHEDERLIDNLAAFAFCLLVLNAGVYLLGRIIIWIWKY